MATAILVDGAFFLKRYRVLYPNGRNADAAAVAKDLCDLVAAHLPTRRNDLAIGATTTQP
jgi:hypothetical protein